MKRIGHLILALVATTCLISCGSNEQSITGTKGKVKRIVNGNTIQLQSGLKVQLLGVASGHESTKIYMENLNLEGKQVKLIADKGDTKQSFVKSSEKVRAYVFVLPENTCLNGDVLRQCAKSDNSVFSAKHLNDSLEAWRLICKGCEHNGALPDIALYMKMRTFLVETPEGLGTGFFISKQGLAITNNHVLPPKYEGSSNVYLYVKDSKTSEIYGEECKRPVKRILASSPLKEYDITVFQVQLNEGEEVPFFHLAKEQAPVGSHIQTFGNPSDKSGIMYTANYTQGTIGSYRDDSQHERPGTQIVTYDIATNPGNSGGPVALDNGVVIAVHDMGSNNGEGINAGINVQHARDMLDKLEVDYYCK